MIFRQSPPSVEARIDRHERLVGGPRLLTLEILALHLDSRKGSQTVPYVIRLVAELNGARDRVEIVEIVVEIV